MDEASKQSPDQLEELVAYLDGELDEAVAYEIEQTLSQDADARQNIDTLTRTWELLDLLPKAQATDQFTTRTLATIQVVEAKETTPQQARSQRRRQLLTTVGWAAGLLLASGIGFFVTNRVIRAEHDLLVEELPLIEQLDAYAEVDNLEFLIQLRESGLFNGDASTDNP